MEVALRESRDVDVIQAGESVRAWTLTAGEAQYALELALPGSRALASTFTPRDWQAVAAVLAPMTCSSK